MHPSLHKSPRFRELYDATDKMERACHCSLHWALQELLRLCLDLDYVVGDTPLLAYPGFESGWMPQVDYEWESFTSRSNSLILLDPLWASGCAAEAALRGMEGRNWLILSARIGKTEAYLPPACTQAE